MTEPAVVFLETPRLVLRQFTMADVDNLFRLNADPEVMRYLTGGAGTPREVVEHEILPRFLDYYRRYTGRGWWAVQEKASGEFIGWFHLRPHDGQPPGETELGYRLRRPAWGRGYATEGSLALIDKAFTDLGAERITAQTMAVNTASRRVLEKAGLSYARTFLQPSPHQIEGSDQGAVEYAITRADWEQRPERE